MSQEIQEHILVKYEAVKKIGSGAYGDVWKVVHRQNKTVHALKKNFDAFHNSTDAQRTYRQIMFLKKLKHPNIVQLQEIIRARNEKDVYLVFEYMDIDLYGLIRQNILSQVHRRYISYQLACALFYLHSAELVHRDIKPSNVLVNQSCLAKLCDFGLVRSVDNEENDDNPILTEYIATRWYRAPEILLGSKQYSKAVDIWSFGCLLAQLIRGKPLFPGTSSLNQIQRVLTWTGPPTLSDVKSLKTHFGKQMLDLLSKIKPINKKQWLPQCSDEAIDLIQKTLQFNPDKRINIIQIIQHPYLREFYHPENLIFSETKIKLEVSDNSKLSLKDYRILIYNQIQGQPQSKGIKLRSHSKESNSRKRTEAIKSKPSSAQDNRFKKNSSKQKQSSVPQRSTKQSQAASLKKKYDSLMGKRQQLSKTKYVKTQERDYNPSDVARMKNNENLVKFFWDKKKKSVSVYQSKRQSQLLAKYMYKNRNC